MKCAGGTPSVSSTKMFPGARLCFFDFLAAARAHTRNNLSALLNGRWNYQIFINGDTFVESVESHNVFAYL